MPAKKNNKNGNIFFQRKTFFCLDPASKVIGKHNVDACVWGGGVVGGVCVCVGKTKREREKKVFTEQRLVSSCEKSMIVCL